MYAYALLLQKEENEEAFRSWLKDKNAQFKKEKLLKRRQEQEMHEGYYIRSREECDKAYKQWVTAKQNRDLLLNNSNGWYW